MYLFLNMCNLCRYARFLQAQSHILNKKVVSQACRALVQQVIFKAIKIQNSQTSNKYLPIVSHLLSPSMKSRIIFYKIFEIEFC